MDLQLEKGKQFEQYLGQFTAKTTILGETQLDETNNR
jgi:hypothetical protein